MNVTQSTPPYFVKEVFKYLFTVKGHYALIAEQSAKGVIIEVDPKQIYAIAHFDNARDYNEFKELALA